MRFVEIEVDETPRSIAALIERTGSPWVDDQVWLFRGRVQNRGPATVYRSLSRAVPDPAAVRGFRHPAGSEARIAVWGADPAMHWFWTAGGTATLVFEEVLVEVGL